MAKAKNPSLYRALRHLRSGGLHRALHVAPDEKIPDSKLEAAKKSNSEHVRHMANFASTLRGFHK
jgi:hypothetical protein